MVTITDNKICLLLGPHVIIVGGKNVCSVARPVGDLHGEFEQLRRDVLSGSLEVTHQVTGELVVTGRDEGVSRTLRT